MTPTQRTLKYLKGEGYLCGIVEKWIPIRDHPAGGVRKDLFDFIDIIALKDGQTTAVQSCGTNFSEHKRTILENQNVIANAIECLNSNWRILLIGWRKLKVKRGGKATKWTPRIEEFSKEDFEDNGIPF
jgi:hypothetical protein